MSGIFPQKQLKEIERAQEHCSRCGEYLSILRRLGLPNETLESQNQFNEQVLREALQIDKEYRERPITTQ